MRDLDFVEVIGEVTILQSVHFFEQFLEKALVTDHAMPLIAESPVFETLRLRELYARWKRIYHKRTHVA